MARPFRRKRHTKRCRLPKKNMMVCFRGRGRSEHWTVTPTHCHRQQELHQPPLLCYPRNAASRAQGGARNGPKCDPKMRSKCDVQTGGLFDTFAGSLPDAFFFLIVFFLRHFFRIHAFSTFWPTGLSSCFDSFRKPESTDFLESTDFSGTTAFLV